MIATHLLRICIYFWVLVVTVQDQSEYECLCRVLKMLDSQTQILDRMNLLEQQMYTLIRRDNVFDDLYMCVCVRSIANNECKWCWINEESSCYFFATQNLTWEEAVRYCQEKESHLVRVDSLLEHNFIKAQLVKLNPYNEQSFWTAGNDRKTEDIFVWGTSNDREDFSLFQSYMA